MNSDRLPLRTFWMVIVLALLECLTSAQIQPKNPSIPDPFEHVVNFELVKPFGSMVPASERVYMQLPVQTSIPNPVVLVFHGLYYDRHLLSGSGNWNLDEQLHQLMDAASLRGWITASLEGGEELENQNVTYANPEMHQRITAVLSDLDNLYGIDSSRIYTIGHSMGGADAVNYAARHQDPTTWRIAAAFSWSGILNTSSLGTFYQKILWAQCDYSNGTLADLASSVVHIDGCNCTMSGTSSVDGSLLFNLAEIPVRVTHASQMEDCQVICGYNAAESFKMSTGELPHLELVPDFNLKHASHEDFDAIAICDNFFGPASLPASLPFRAYKTVVVEDVRYFYFDAKRAPTYVPGEFDWDFTSAPNTLQINNAKSIRELRFRVDDSSPMETPLVSSGAMTIECSVTDSALSYQLDNCQNGPMTVYLNNTQVMSSPTTWEYKATEQILLLKLQSGPWVKWEILF